MALHRRGIAEGCWNRYEAVGIVDGECEIWGKD